MVVPPGEGVLFTPREIFSFRDRSRVTSDSRCASRCCSWRFVFSKLLMWFVAVASHRLERCQLCATVLKRTSLEQ